MTRPVDEAVGADGAHSRRWAVWHHQFDLTRVEDGLVYLTRWWLIKTPWGGLALHRMTAPDARSTLHDHPFSFVSIPIVGGYIERRLDPFTMTTHQRIVKLWRRRRPSPVKHVRVNVMRHGGDAHTITGVQNPTWTLLLIGKHRRTWGFWAPTEYGNVDLPDRAMWTWTKHDAFDSGHYA